MVNARNISSVQSQRVSYNLMCPHRTDNFIDDTSDVGGSYALRRIADMP